MCSTMTMKIARGMLETRLELPAGSLKAVKDTVAQVIDQVCSGKSPAARMSAVTWKDALRGARAVLWGNVTSDAFWILQLCLLAGSCCACCALPQLLVRNAQPIESASLAKASQRDDDSGDDEQEDADEDADDDADEHADEDAEQDENRPPKRQRNKDAEPRRKAKKKVAVAPSGMRICWT